MGILQTLGLAPSAQLLPSNISSPWAEGSLSTVVWSEVFGEDIQRPLSRAEAMTVPAVSRARNLIATTIARLPMVAMRGDETLSDEQQPAWMYRTDGAVSPYMRNVWTIDDLMFYGAALWSVTRDSEGRITAADRVPFEWWSVTPDGAILIRDQAVDARSVIYFPSHTDALLVAAKTTIETARSTALSVSRRASSPVPVMEIHHVDDNAELKRSEALELVKAYNAARRDPEGATVFTPAHVELKAHGANADSGALVEARNAARLDVANHSGIPASLLEGSSAGASLTYVTTEGKRSEFLEYGVMPWIETMQTRLSLDDVLPRGQRARFDLSELLATTPSATGAEVQD